MPGLRGLYAIVDPQRCGDRDPVALAAAILRGGCGALQLRDKRGDDRQLLALAGRLRALCAAASVPFVLNDRADLAVLAGADGLHLGQRDLPTADARALVGALPVGRSTHDLAQARAAAAAGADLIGFGPVFATGSKDGAAPAVGLDALARVCAESTVPVVAIGGLDGSRAAAAHAAGARMVAVIAALAAAGDPERAARALHLAAGGAAC